jgi:hypothetical protein
MLFDCVCHKGVVNVFWQMLAKELGSTNFYTNDIGNFLGGGYWYFFFGKISHCDNKKLKKGIFWSKKCLVFLFYNFIFLFFWWVF